VVGASPTSGCWRCGVCTWRLRDRHGSLWCVTHVSTCTALVGLALGAALTSCGSVVPPRATLGARGTGTGH